MILTDKEIRSLCVGKDVSMIDFFEETSLQSESYDLSIGDKIATLRKETFCINIDNQDEIDMIYEEKTLDDNGYILSPHEYILVKIKERITLPENITAHIRPRTRYTRLGLLISDQHCNSTYSGFLQLGFYNATNYAIKILPSMKIAQIVFEELKSIPSKEKQYRNKKNAAYQNEADFKGADFSNEFNEKVDQAIKVLLGKDG